MALGDSVGVEAVKELERTGIPEAEQAIEKATDHATSDLQSVLNGAMAQLGGMVDNFRNEVSVLPGNLAAQLHGVLDRLNGTTIDNAAGVPILRINIRPEVKPDAAS